MSYGQSFLLKLVSHRADLTGGEKIGSTRRRRLSMSIDISDPPFTNNNQTFLEDGGAIKCCLNTLLPRILDRNPKRVQIQIAVTLKTIIFKVIENKAEYSDRFLNTSDIDYFSFPFCSLKQGRF